MGKYYMGDNGQHMGHMSARRHVGYGARLTLEGWLKRMPRLKPEMVAMSSSERSNSMLARLEAMSCSRVLLGMMARPRWVAQRRRTCEGSRLYLAAIFWMVSSSMRGVSLTACCMLNSRKLAGPKEL